MQHMLIKWTNIFDRRTNASDMTKTDSQAIHNPYQTTNTPPLTTHHALIVCGALRRVCPCDDDRDAKEDDRDDVFVASEQFSRKQLRNATTLVLRRQKPSINMPWMDCICRVRIVETRWVEGCAEESLPRRTCGADGKVELGFVKYTT